MRCLNESITDLGLAEVLDFVTLRIVNKSGPAAKPFVKTSVTRASLKLLELSSNILFLIFRGGLNAVS